MEVLVPNEHFGPRLPESREPNQLAGDSGLSSMFAMEVPVPKQHFGPRLPESREPNQLAGDSGLSSMFVAGSLIVDVGDSAIGRDSAQVEDSAVVWDSVMSVEVDGPKRPHSPSRWALPSA